MNRENFGRFIADARRNKGITQQSLADQLHVTNSAVSKWERGLCYPDVVLLEDLAGALGLTLTELLACEYAAGSNPNTNCIQNNMTSLRDIANESNRNQRIRTIRNILIAVLSAVILISTVLITVSFLQVNSAGVVYIGSQSIDSQNYVYMDMKGDLLRLRCEDPQMFQAIVSGWREERYIIQYRWNFISGEGELIDCQVDSQYLGTPMDEVGNISVLDELFGIRGVQQEITNIYPDPNHSHRYIYSLRYYYPGSQHDFLTVKNCRDLAYYDYDNDGVIELLILTIYDNAPYMLYDRKDGVIFSSFVDNVPEEIIESLSGF